MRQANSRDVGHAAGPRHKVALGPEVVGHQGDRRDAESGELDAVTHGAGGATSSMPVGGNDGIAVCDNLVTDRVRDHDGDIALVVVNERGVRKQRGQ